MVNKIGSLIAIVSLGVLVSISYNNCSKSGMDLRSVAADVSPQTLSVDNDVQCQQGAIAVGVNNSNNQVICVPMQNSGTQQCVSGNVIYDYQQNVAICLDLQYLSQPGVFCPVGQHLASVSNGTISCRINPAYLPNHSCPGGATLLGVLGNQLICDSQGPSQPNYLCPQGQYLHAVNNGSLTCKDVTLSNGEITCANGQAIVGYAQGAAVCQDILFHPGSGVYQAPDGEFVSSLNNGGEGLSLPELSFAHACPTNTYLSKIDNGEMICSQLPNSGFFNGTCPAGQYVMGYDDSQFICSTNSTVVSVNGSCPAGSYMRGSSNGQIVCSPFVTSYPLCVPGSLEYCVDHTSGSVGTKLCNSTGDAYGSCGNYTSCLPGYDYNNGVCTPVVTCSPGAICPIDNGFGKIACNGSQSTCEVWQCNFGYAIDNGMCVRSCPAGYQLQGNDCVDVGMPILEWINKPSTQVSQTGSVTSFSFRAYDNETGIDRVECRINSGSFQACTNDILANLPAGSHTAFVRAFDRAGNSVMIQDSWVKAQCQPGSIFTTLIDNGFCDKLCNSQGLHSTTCTQVRCFSGFSEQGGMCKDITPPVIVWTSFPPSVVTGGTVVSIGFHVEDISTITTLECRRENTAFTNCQELLSTWDISVTGDHFFEVRATDEWGNTSTSMKSWTVQ